MINNLAFHLDPPQARAFIKVWRICITSIPGQYSVAIMIIGSQGDYRVSGEGGYPLKTAHALSWPLKLSAGSPSNILPLFTMLHDSEVGGKIKKITVPKHSKFPALHVYIEDESRNVCLGFNGVRTSLESSDCPGWRKQLSYVKDGCASFEAFPLDVDIGEFNVSIVVEEMNLQESLELVVVHGNYPSELRLESDDYREFALTGSSEEYLPIVELTITSADEKPLQHQINIVFKFLTETQKLYLEKDYLISLHTNDIVMDTFFVIRTGKSLGLRFSRIASHREAGLYQVQVFIRERLVYIKYKCLSVSGLYKFSLCWIVRMVRHQRWNLKAYKYRCKALQARVTDLYGNKCVTMSGIKLCHEMFWHETSRRFHSLPTNRATVQKSSPGWHP